MCDKKHIMPIILRKAIALLFYESKQKRIAIFSWAIALRWLGEWAGWGLISQTQYWYSQPEGLCWIGASS